MVMEGMKSAYIMYVKYSHKQNRQSEDPWSEAVSYTTEEMNNIFLNTTK